MKKRKRQVGEQQSAYQAYEDRAEELFLLLLLPEERDLGAETELRLAVIVDISATRKGKYDI